MDIYVCIHTCIWFYVDIYPKYLLVIIAIQISIPINKYPHLEQDRYLMLHMDISEDF